MKTFITFINIKPTAVHYPAIQSAECPMSRCALHCACTI